MVRQEDNGSAGGPQAEVILPRASSSGQDLPSGHVKIDQQFRYGVIESASTAFSRVLLSINRVDPDQAKKFIDHFVRRVDRNSDAINRKNQRLLDQRLLNARVALVVWVFAFLFLVPGGLYFINEGKELSGLICLLLGIGGPSVALVLSNRVGNPGRAQASSGPSPAESSPGNEPR